MLSCSFLELFCPGAEPHGGPSASDLANRVGQHCIQYKAVSFRVKLSPVTYKLGPGASACRCSLRSRYADDKPPMQDQPTLHITGGSDDCLQQSVAPQVLFNMQARARSPGQQTRHPAALRPQPAAPHAVPGAPRRSSAAGPAWPPNPAGPAIQAIAFRSSACAMICNMTAGHAACSWHTAPCHVQGMSIRAWLSGQVRWKSARISISLPPYQAGPRHVIWHCTPLGALGPDLRHPAAAGSASAAAWRLPAALHPSVPGSSGTPAAAAPPSATQQ